MVISPEDHDHTSLSGTLAGDLGERILLEAGIENGVRDLVTEEMRSAKGCGNYVHRRTRWVVEYPRDRGLCEAAEEKRLNKRQGEEGQVLECATYQILSGWPSPTDSEVKRKVLFWAAVSWEGTTAGYVWLGQTYLVGRAVDTVGDSHLGRYGWRGRCGRGNVGIAGGGWEGGGASVGLATACLTTGKKKKGLGWVGEKRGMEGKAGRRAL